MKAPSKDDRTNHASIHRRLADPANTEEVRRGLRDHLLEMNFHAFARCVVLLLEKMGCEQVRLAGRTEWRGHNRNGGFDLVATLPSVLGERTMVISLKQYDKLLVFQRSVDELRGACLRSGADEALLITTGRFSSSVKRTGDWDTPLNCGPRIASVRLMDGESLLVKLMEHSIGVWEELPDQPDGQVRLGVDTAFFQELARNHFGNGRDGGDTPIDIEPPSKAKLRVTVAVESIPSRFHLPSHREKRILATKKTVSFPQ